MPLERERDQSIPEYFQYRRNATAAGIKKTMKKKGSSSFTE
jgi:hypothetical protein